MKWVALSVVVVILVAGAFFLGGGDSVCFDVKCVDVEIADTPELREIGLMFRESLGEDEGMLFVYDEQGMHSFWMKDTLIPLDIIWISEDFEVMHVEHAVPCESDPCKRYVPDAGAKYVLEVNEDFAERYRIRPGDRVRLD